MDESFEQREEEIYSQGGVFYKSKKHHYGDYDNFSGQLSIKNCKHGNYTIEWKPSTEANVESDTQEPDWAMVNTKARKDRTLSSSSDSARAERVAIDLSKVGSFRVNRHGRKVSIKLRDERKPSIYFTFSSADHPAIFITELCRLTPALKSQRDSNLYIICQDNKNELQRLNRSFSELKLEDGQQNLWHFIGHLKENPYEATMGAFSKITDVLLHRGGEERPEEVSDLLTQSLTRDNAEDLKMGEASASGDDYEVIPVAIRLEDCKPPPRGPPLNRERWTQGMDPEGRITDPNSIKKLIFRGGVADDLRAEVWKFLFGMYPWNSTHSERVAIRASRVEEYFTMKRQWESITLAQEERFSDFKDRKSLIGKDVHRTDRVLPFFAGDDNPNVQSLMHVLMTYVMYNFDLGYVQGMSDLLAPLLELFNNEVDAFWCFVGFMDKVGSNFDMDQEGMKQQLLGVRTLIALLDPKLLNYLEKNDSGNMFFCFRWLIVLFKREFSRDDVMRLWEVLCSDLPCANFQLLLSVAVLEAEKNVFYEGSYSFHEILKHVNELSMNINLDDMISRAEGIYRLLIEKEHDLPDCIRVILGLPPLNLNLWVPQPLPAPGSQNQGKKSPTRSKNQPSPQSNSQCGAGEPGTTGRTRSPGSDSEKDSSIETLPNGYDVEDSFEKALTSHYY